jgi:hypothetical protein
MYLYKKYIMETTPIKLENNCPYNWGTDNTYTLYNFGGYYYDFSGMNIADYIAYMLSINGPKTQN